MSGPAHDSFRSPNNSNHTYDVLPTDASIDSADLSDLDHVTFVSTSGAETVGIEAVNADRLRLRPRLGKRSVAQAIETANARWALGDNEMPVDNEGENA